MKDFAILHHFETTQFLVIASYEPEPEEFKIDIRFWSEKLNAHATITLSWGVEDEAGYKEAFEHLKDKAIAEDYFKKLPI